MILCLAADELRYTTAGRLLPQRGELDMQRAAVYRLVERASYPIA